MTGSFVHTDFVVVFVAYFRLSPLDKVPGVDI